MLTGMVIGPLAVPSYMAAQSERPAASSKSLSDQETRGKHLFLQNCSLCHLATYAKMADWKESESTPRPVGPRLAGLFNGATQTQEKVIRTAILNGTDKMPGFKYALNQKQIDDLLAYLKTQ